MPLARQESGASDLGQTAATVRDASPVETIDGLRYSSHHTVDVYRPAGGASWPVAVHIGAPGFHRHASNVTLARAVAANGVLVLQPSYELGWAARDLSDLATFLPSAVADQTAHPRGVTVVGISSGLAFAALWAFAGSLPAPAEAPLAEGERAPVVEGFVGAGGLYGAFLWPLLGGNRLLRVRIVHGREDELAPLAQVNPIHEALQKAGYEVQLLIGSGSHADTFDPSHPLGRTTVETIVRTAHGG